jgi:hypothetical protein
MGVLVCLLCIHPVAEVVVEYETIIDKVYIPGERASTPLIDSMIDWDDFDRQTECLWQLLQERELEITYDIVIAAGICSDANGGACAMIGEKDE